MRANFNRLYDRRVFMSTAVAVGLLAVSGCGNNEAGTQDATENQEPQAVVEGEQKMQEYMESEQAKSDLGHN